MKMEDIKPVSKCECGHERMTHDWHHSARSTRCGVSICQCPSFTPSIPQAEKVKLVWQRHDEPTQPQTPEWRIAFRNLLNSLDALSVQAQTITPIKRDIYFDGYEIEAFISKQIEIAQGQGRIQGREEWKNMNVSEALIKQAEQLGYERREKEEKLAANPEKWRFTLEELEQAKTEERQRIKSLIEEKAREKFMSADEWYEYILTLIEARGH